MRTMVRPKKSTRPGQQEDEHEQVLAPLLAVAVGVAGAAVVVSHDRSSDSQQPVERQRREQHGEIEQRELEHALGGAVAATVVRRAPDDDRMADEAALSASATAP